MRNHHAQPEEHQRERPRQVDESHGGDGHPGRVGAGEAQRSRQHGHHTGAQLHEDDHHAKDDGRKQERHPGSLHQGDGCPMGTSIEPSPGGIERRR